jgi:plastocyanin
MRRSLVTLFACLALAAGGALAGCGGDDDEGGNGGGSAQGSGDGGGNVVTIHMKDIQFDPKEVTVKAGQTVRWVNDDDVEHNAVARSGAEFKSELFGKGETYETKVDQAGTVAYVCTVHPAMTGTLTVQ